jgi:hypothetical protein
MDPEKLARSVATNGITPGFEDAGAPGPINHATGQHTSYWTLSEEERAKGFVRPVRKSYVHVGTRPKYPLRDLTAEELVQYKQWDYIKYEEYPAGSTSLGKFWTQKELTSGCNTTTTMGDAIAETYACDPTYYGSTFCVSCGRHFPVGPESQGGQFKWTGSDEYVGT